MATVLLLLATVELQPVHHVALVQIRDSLKCSLDHLSGLMLVERLLLDDLVEVTGDEKTEGFSRVLVF